MQLKENWLTLNLIWRFKAWERRNSEFVLYESQRELESQRHQWRQASQWAVLGNPTFPINIVSCRVPEGGRAATLECREIHEMIWVFGVTFLKTYTSRRILKKNQRIWRHHLWPERIRREINWRKNWAKNLFNTIPIPCFQRKARCKSHEGGHYHSLMTGVQNHASGLGIRDIKYRKCILANSQTLRNSKAGKWTSEQKYARKQRILVSSCDRSEESK